MVHPQVAEEEPVAPEDLLRLAEKKAEAVAAQFPQALVIAADTGVFRDGCSFGKPRDREEAKFFLRTLSGSWHSVYTGLVVRLGPERRRRLVETRVLFRPLSPEEIAWYLKKEKVLDKAGAYGIQGRAAAFVERIEGDFYNVMGLPLCALWQILLDLGWRPNG